MTFTFDLWPWKSIGFQILFRTKYVPRLVKIHWRMLILDCSKGCYGRTDGSVTISLGLNIFYWWITYYFFFSTKTWKRTTWRTIIAMLVSLLSFHEDISILHEILAKNPRNIIKASLCLLVFQTLLNTFDLNQQYTYILYIPIHWK